ncbi:hypothetical protein [Streptomyces cinereoruber]|uniref:hypothetical protein n=1 Tax=Streptomyces cinereoruber TaxID=67260 RepID=UPI003638D266
MNAITNGKQLAQIADLIGEAKPATDALLVQLGESVRDRLAHDHSTQREDWYCMNLTSFMGERMGPVLRRLLDAEAEVVRLQTRLAELDRPNVEAQRQEVRESYYALIGQAREDRDYEGAFNVECNLREREEQWKAEDLAASQDGAR